MIEGTDYHITVDPKGNSQDAWSVIMGSPWDRVVGRYRNVEITEGGKNLSFAFEPQFVPEGIDLQCEEFEDYCSTVLASIIRDQHENGGMLYTNKETGERVDYE
jgi:hypothetical protein